MDDSPVRANASSKDIGGSCPATASAGYKSWKKKYRKMRIAFDRKMHEGEELHKHEAKASAMVKRLAVENDRLLDILLEINNSPQIPSDKRIDIALPSIEPDAPPALPLDREEHAIRKDAAARHLEALLADVPHLSYASAKDSHPSYVTDLGAPTSGVGGSGESSHPAHFLSADDVDNYIHEVDVGVAEPDAKRLPTMAPYAVRPNSRQTANPHLINPTSVTNWLRKHAPRVFLQDGESHGHADGDDGEAVGGGGGGGGAGGHAKEKKPAARKSRPSSGGLKGDVSGSHSKKSAKKSRKPIAWKTKSSEINSAAVRAAHGLDSPSPPGADADASMDDDATDLGPSSSTAAAAAAPAKGKRKRDDDPGYRPKGGSGSRPTKKKRKSEGGDSVSGGGRKVKRESNVGVKEE